MPFMPLNIFFTQPFVPEIPYPINNHNYECYKYFVTVPLVSFFFRSRTSATELEMANALEIHVEESESR